jgi:hypothetical protein
LEDADFHDEILCLGEATTRPVIIGGSIPQHSCLFKREYPPCGSFREDVKDVVSSVPAQYINIPMQINTGWTAFFNIVQREILKIGKGVAYAIHAQPIMVAIYCRSGHRGTGNSSHAHGQKAFGNNDGV